MASGAELLILQQSIRHYIEISQTRQLANHEKTEYQKLAAALVPALKRFTEAPSKAAHPPAQTRSDTAIRVSSKPVTSAMSNNVDNAVSDKIPVSVKKESSTQIVGKPEVSLRQKPTILGAKSTNRPQTDLLLTGSTVLNPKTNSNKKDEPTKRPTALNPKANAIKKSQDETSRRPTKKQRPLPPNSTQSESKTNHRKRTATLGASSDDDDDKENMDPRRPYSGRRRTTIEGASVAVIRSQINPRTVLANSRDNIVNILGGNNGHVERGSFTITGAIHHLDYPSRTLPSNSRSMNVTRDAQSSPRIVSQESMEPVHAQSQQARRHSRILSQATRRESQIHSQDASQQPRIQSQEQLLISPVQPRVAHNRSGVSSDDARLLRPQSNDEISLPPIDPKVHIPYTLSQETLQDFNLEPQEAPPASELVQEPHNPQVALDGQVKFEKQNEALESHNEDRSVHLPVEIPPSVEDDNESVKSFDDLRELAPEEPETVGQNQSCAHCLEAPSIADFADIPDSQCSQSSQDSLQPTLAVPLFLQNSLLENFGEFVPAVGGQEGVFPSESSKLIDGVWCFDEFKENILATVCSNLEEWIAIETKTQVQFWKLEDKVSLSNCKWMTCVQLDKSSTATRIMFAPDDSLAVVVDMINCTLVRVPLTNEVVNGDISSLSSAFWKDAPFSQSCSSFLMEGQHGHKLIVAGSTSVGSVCLFDVSAIYGSDHPCPSQILVHANTIATASSIVQVKNSESLIVATFGESIVLWDLMSSKKPVAVIDASSALSSFRLSGCSQQLLNPIIVTATVPSKFLQAFNGSSQAVIDTLPASLWPIFMCLGVKNGASYHLDNEYDQCALFLMNGSKIELVHKYRGTSSISSAFASTRFLACQTMTPGGKAASLQLWDICSSESVANMDLVASTKALDVLSNKPRQSWTPSKSASFLSSRSSTLSSPPSSSDDDEEDAESANIKVLPKLSRPTLQPAQSLNLRSVAFLDRAAEVQFALHGLHHWAVIVKHVHQRSTIHVVDFGSLLH